MKTLLASILFLIVNLGFAQESTFEVGNKAYASEDYSTAIENYQDLLDGDYLSSNLFYNLGDAYYRNNELGKAIWAYESALKIEPKNQDAKENLDFCIAQTLDKIDNTKPGIGTWFARQLFGSNINKWAILSIITSVFLAFSLFLFFKTKKRKQRNFGLFFGVFSSFFLIFSVVIAQKHKNSIQENNHAIVIYENARVRLSPIETAQISFELNEGTKVHLIDVNSDWLEIEVNGNKGWIFKDEVWEI